MQSPHHGVIEKVAAFPGVRGDKPWGYSPEGRLIVDTSAQAAVTFAEPGHLLFTSDGFTQTDLTQA